MVSFQPQWFQKSNHSKREKLENAKHRGLQDLLLLHGRRKKFINFKKRYFSSCRVYKSSLFPSMLGVRNFVILFLFFLLELIFFCIFITIFRVLFVQLCLKGIYISSSYYNLCCLVYVSSLHFISVVVSLSLFSFVYS